MVPTLYVLMRNCCYLFPLCQEEIKRIYVLDVIDGDCALIFFVDIYSIIFQVFKILGLGAHFVVFVLSEFS